MAMKIAVIGTGLMGSALADALIDAGFDVIVFNRSPAKLAPLVARGATAAATAGEAIAAADAALVVLADAASIADVLLDEANAAALVGRKLINIATISPDEIELLASRVAAHGGSLAEATVLAYPHQVRAQLAQYVLGCAACDEAFWSGIFGPIGTKIFRCGDVGDASRGDLAFAAAFAFNVTAAAFTAAMAKKLNVPSEIVLHQLTASPAMTITGADNLLPQMFARQYEESLASVDTVRMALEMMLPQARAIGVPTQILEGFLDIYSEASERGLGGKDIASIYEVLMGPNRNGSARP